MAREMLGRAKKVDRQTGRQKVHHDGAPDGPGRPTTDNRTPDRPEPFTDRFLRNLRPTTPARDVRDATQRGLVARALPSGRVQFSMRYRFQGKQRRLMLGEYDSTSLAEARKRARRAQTAVDDGRDPAAEQRAAKAERTDTVDELAKEYLAKHARKFKRTADQDDRLLRVEVLPTWGDRSVRDLSRRDVRALVERLATRAPILANRVLALVHRMFNFAIDHEWLESNPAARVRKPSPERSRDRVLTADEVRRLWRVLSNLPQTADRPAPGRKRQPGKTDDPLCPISGPLAALLQVRLLTAQRGGETARMRWADLDLDAGWWTIPADDAKNGQQHRVPLSADALTIITAQEPDATKRDTYVFTGRGGSMVLDRAKKAPAVVARVLGITFRGHDLRRTAATGMAEAGISREHIAAVLNHRSVTHASVTAIYDRYSYDAEKRIALDAWARRLHGILNGEKVKKIIPFAK